ncbi:uncharacterized protein LOC141543963 [Sminthopsis crassicaudata]|uniref:uncharacterized protein LOC141543963 n=1 Tax=Sminthopsis crassicaudata TaxID=9301 RepID=UPI003D68ED97
MGVQQAIPLQATSVQLQFQSSLSPSTQLQVGFQQSRNWPRVSESMLTNTDGFQTSQHWLFLDLSEGLVKRLVGRTSAASVLKAPNEHQQINTFALIAPFLLIRRGEPSKASDDGKIVKGRPAPPEEAAAARSRTIDPRQLWEADAELPTHREALSQSQGCTTPALQPSRAPRHLTSEREHRRNSAIRERGAGSGGEGGRVTLTSAIPAFPDPGSPPRTKAHGRHRHTHSHSSTHAHAPPTRPTAFLPPCLPASPPPSLPGRTMDPCRSQG